MWCIHEMFATTYIYQVFFIRQRERERGMNIDESFKKPRSIPFKWGIQPSTPTPQSPPPPPTYQCHQSLGHILPSSLSSSTLLFLCFQFSQGCFPIPSLKCKDEKKRVDAGEVWPGIWYPGGSSGVVCNNGRRYKWNQWNQWNQAIMPDTWREDVIKIFTTRWVGSSTMSTSHGSSRNESLKRRWGVRCNMSIKIIAWLKWDPFFHVPS